MIEINKIDMVNFIDKNTKKSILKLNDVKNTSIHQKCETVCNYTLKGECKCINKKYESYLSFVTNKFNMDLLMKVKVLSAEVSHAQDSYCIQSKRLVKVKRIIKIKRHRKKRINKKLNKKYGHIFKMEFVNDKNYKLMCDPDGKVIVEKEI